MTSCVVSEFVGHLLFEHLEQIWPELPSTYLNAALGEIVASQATGKNESLDEHCGQFAVSHWSRNRTEVPRPAHSTHT